MNSYIMSIIGLIFLAVLMYGCYWTAKTVSYAVFYQDMVEGTVREMVKKEALR